MCFLPVVTQFVNFEIPQSKPGQNKIDHGNPSNRLKRVREPVQDEISTLAHDPLHVP